MRKYTAILIILIAISSLIIFNKIQPFNKPSNPIVIDQDLDSHPIYSTYEFSSDPSVIKIGTQPLYIASSVITEFMSRDLILKNQLEELGVSLVFYPFLKGNDLNYFMNNDMLDVGVGGDMPAIRMVSNDGVDIVSLISEGPGSIISKNAREIQDLRNKKIGYPFGSNSHYNLVNTLLQNGVSLDSVQLIPMDITEMSSALENGEIDAFTAWEPTPTIALETHPEFIITHQGRIYSFIYMKREIIEERPDVVFYLLASEIRAIQWMKASDYNILTAISWVNTESLKLQPNATLIDSDILLKLVKQDLPGILIKEYPRISEDLIAENGHLENEYELAKSLGLVPEDSEWVDVLSSINLEMLEVVISEPEKYRLFEVPDFRMDDDG